MMGAPANFDTPEELQVKIEEYFNQESIPTITGLAYFLGFESRQSFYDYEKRDSFSYTIKRSRLRMEGKYEERLFSNANAGAIFALKNFGWTDKHEIDQKTIIKDERIDPSKLTDAELRTLAEIQRKSGVSEA